MMNTVAILSMLHEPACGSARRLFRGREVLAWTLQRLSRAVRLQSKVVLCWDEQAEEAASVAGQWGARVVAKGPRAQVATMQAISAAQRWSDGWRGGLLATCRFDLGFHGPWHEELAAELAADAVVLVEPSAGLVDPELIDGLIAHAEAHPSRELCFMQVAPGLGGVLLRRSLLKRLAEANAHPGRLLHYFDDQLGKEPIATDACAPVPTPVARSRDRFTLDSDRQAARIAGATEPLNGQLAASRAEELVQRMGASDTVDVLPREIVLELNTTRASKPVFWPGELLAIERPDFSRGLAEQLFGQMSLLDETRLTLAGVGDPLCCPSFFEIVDLAHSAGLAIHVETDLLDVSPETINRLGGCGIDVISIHLPALSPQTYAAVMGRDGYAGVLENIRQLLLGRRGNGSSIPIVVPIFTKCRQNLGQMEAWYDQWLRAVGSAVIRGPSCFGGQVPDVAVADMCPSRRRPCGRLNSRIMVLSDGRLVSCEEDVTGRQVMGHLADGNLSEIWRKRFEALRDDHRKEKLDLHPLCGTCREWHRP